MKPEEYHLDNVVNRLAVLDTIIAHQFEKKNEFDFKNPRLFTNGEITCINQERMSLREFKEYLFRQRKHEDVRFISVSTHIETKIQNCLQLIEDTKWQRNINQIKVITDGSI